MLRVTCDGCGREVRPGEDHHIVKIEVFAARDPHQLTEEDLDEDHLEAVAEILVQAEQAGEEIELEPRSKQMRYDLCCACRKRYLRDPLGRETSQKFHFSPN